TDEEVEKAVFGCGPWKAPDSHGVQMGFIHRGWPVLGEWIRRVFKSSVALGLFPNRLKASDALPTPKPAKKDKTHPKAYRPVEHHGEALAKPLEALMARRISHEAEVGGMLREEQFGG
ncbi:hypothetical protein C8F04DRAFT_887735, partial [Mycena alexandri]